ncbi:MAG TPA: hypothetical protein VG055_12940 [Planctomycetaceae bacterium]|jgi:hypothetical protein|nr:hypothetical protein [Planctomycetaceae bacterium]
MNDKPDGASETAGTAMSQREESMVDKSRGLIARILARPDDASGQDFNDLLSLFFRGAPIAMLRELLDCPKGALFIAGELGDKATPFLETIARFLGRKDSRIRSSSYNALAHCSSRGEASAFMHVTLGIRDSDAGAAIWRDSRGAGRKRATRPSEAGGIERRFGDSYVCRRSNLVEAKIIALSNQLNAH